VARIGDHHPRESPDRLASVEILHPSTDPAPPTRRGVSEPRPLITTLVNLRAASAPYLVTSHRCTSPRPVAHQTAASACRINTAEV
jgi:hypothetical protein